MRHHRYFFALLSALVLTLASALAACDAGAPSEETAALTADASRAPRTDSDSSSNLAGPTITSVGGFSDGVGVTNGRWNEPGSDYLGFLAIDSYLPSTNYVWKVKGSGFGSSPGTFTFSNSSYTATIVSWSNTEIRVRPRGPRGFGSRTLSFTVRTSSGQTATRTESTMELINSRGMGQCTYHVAHRRLQAGLGIPLPSAYSQTASITASYVPKKYDGLKYDTRHVAIITSTPVVETLSDGTVKYTFTVSEMNWNRQETVATSTRTFKVRNGSVVGRIGSLAGSTYWATGYWR